jgi:S-adenosylmethionine hydrolase
MNDRKYPSSPHFGSSKIVDAYEVEIDKLRAELEHEKQFRDQQLSSELKVLEARLDSKATSLIADGQNKLAALKAEVVALVTQKLQIIGAIGGLLGVMAFFGVPKYFELTLNSKIDSFEKNDAEILTSLTSDDSKYKDLITKASQQNTLVLASDYGEHDAYVEGILGRLEVLSSGLHRPQYIELPINNPLAAAAKLSFVIKYFPRGTVIAALYNPDGVDNTQIISWLKNGKVFVGTNNSLSTAFIQTLGGSDHAVRLEKVPEVGRFHDPTLWGISRIAPAAAAIASAPTALNPTDFGDTFQIPVEKTAPEDSNRATGWVIAADRLGNCVTSIAIAELKDRFGSTDKFSIQVGKEALKLPLIHNFADGAAHAAFGIDFDGVLNLAVKSGSFPDEHPECKEGALVTVAGEP